MKFTDIPFHILDDIFDKVEIINKYDKKETLWEKRYDMVLKQLTSDYNNREKGLLRGNYYYFFFNFYLKNKKFKRQYYAEILDRKSFVLSEIKILFGGSDGHPGLSNEIYCLYHSLNRIYDYEETRFRVFKIKKTRQVSY